jgi:hypothetical protein
MEGFRTWSVGLDDGVVTASLPEPLRFPSGPLPEWMGRCAGAIRDSLRELPIATGTLLEARLGIAASADADLGEALLSNVRIPEAHVHAGVRLRRTAAAGPGVLQTYRRVPIAVAAEDGDEAVLASVRVPLTGVFELDSARLAWLATRRVVVVALPTESAARPGGVELRARLVTESERERGSTELIEKVFAGIRASFQAYTGDDLEGTARRLAAELRGDEAEMSALLSSPRGVLLGAGERFAAAEIIIGSGEHPQLEIELRPSRKL